MSLCFFFFPLSCLLSVGGGEPLHGLPVLCTRVLPILWGKVISDLWYTAFSLLIFLLSVTHSCPFFFLTDLNQGAGLLHHLPLGDPFRFLCVSLSGGKRASVHGAARRWDIFWVASVFVPFLTSGKLCKFHKSLGITHIRLCDFTVYLNKYRIIYRAPSHNQPMIIK